MLRLRNTCLLSAVLLLPIGSSAIAQTAVSAPPTALNARPPAGMSTAVFPAPRNDWESRAETSTDKAKKLGNAIQLVFDGDSITDGWQSKGQEIWAKRYARFGAFDFGISGDRTENVLWRLEHGQAEGLHPKLIALMIGTNNLGRNTPEEIADGVKAIVAAYRQHCPDAVVLLQAVFPRGASATDPNRDKIKKINQIISKLDDGSKVIYIDFGDKFLQPDKTLSPDIMPDFLHPNQKGYEIWADAIQPVIDKYLGAK